MARDVKVQKPKAIPMREFFDPRKMKAWRKRRNLSQGELAERMGWTFVSGGSCISRYETSPFRKKKQLPAKDTLDLIAAALNVDVGQLLSSKDELLDSLRLMFEERRTRPKGSRRQRQRHIFDELVLKAKNEAGQELVESLNDLDRLREMSRTVVVEDSNGDSVSVSAGEFGVEDLEDGEFDEVEVGGE